MQVDDLVAVDLRSLASRAPTTRHAVITLKSDSAPHRASLVSSLMKSTKAMMDTIQVRTMVIHWDVLDPTSKAAKRSLQKRNEMSVVVALLIFRVWIQMASGLFKCFL